MTRADGGAFPVGHPKPRARRHSYGGAVISNAAVGVPNVKALVYIAAFAPDTGGKV